MKKNRFECFGKLALCLIAFAGFTACDENHSTIEVHDKKNIQDHWAEVTFTNVTTGQTITTGNSKQFLTIVELVFDASGKITEANINKNHKELNAKNGDVLRVDYKPFVHFAENHQETTKMSVDFWGTSVTPQNYSTEYKVENIDNGIYAIQVDGDCPKDSKWGCSLHEKNYIYVRIVNEER